MSNDAEQVTKWVEQMFKETAAAKLAVRKSDTQGMRDALARMRDITLTANRAGLQAELAAELQRRGYSGPAPSGD